MYTTLTQLQRILDWALNSCINQACNISPFVFVFTGIFVHCLAVLCGTPAEESLDLHLVKRKVFVAVLFSFYQIRGSY